MGPLVMLQNLPDETLALCKRSDAILLGAIRGPMGSVELRPGSTLITFTQRTGPFCQSSTRSFPGLLHASTLKEEVIKGVDIL